MPLENSNRSFGLVDGAIERRVKCEDQEVKQSNIMLQYKYSDNMSTFSLHQEKSIVDIHHLRLFKHVRRS